jgi:hypothetical protein
VRGPATGQRRRFGVRVRPVTFGGKCDEAVAVIGGSCAGGDDRHREEDRGAVGAGGQHRQLIALQSAAAAAVLDPYNHRVAADGGGRRRPRHLPGGGADGHFLWWAMRGLCCKLLPSLTLYGLSFVFRNMKSHALFILLLSCHSSCFQFIIVPSTIVPLIDI